MSEANCDAPPQRAVIVDIETTGINVELDEILELGMVLFEYSPATGEVGQILDCYCELDDPFRLIPQDAIAIHRITPEMVFGKRLNKTRIEKLLEGVSLVIAHNAAFDRPFLERRLPIFETLPWACSYMHVPWQEEGMASGKLEHIAASLGFTYECHRSEEDCRALLEVLRRPLPRSGVSGFSLLLKNATEPACRLWATDSPYRGNETLRQRGYRWDGQQKCWGKVLPQATLEEEGRWLKAEVYRYLPCRVQIEELNPLTNFSARGVRRPMLIG